MIYHVDINKTLLILSQNHTDWSDRRTYRTDHVRLLSHSQNLSTYLLDLAPRKTFLCRLRLSSWALWFSLYTKDSAFLGPWWSIPWYSCCSKCENSSPVLFHTYPSCPRGRSRMFYQRLSSLLTSGPCCFLPADVIPFSLERRRDLPSTLIYPCFCVLCWIKMIALRTV